MLWIASIQVTEVRRYSTVRDMDFIKYGSQITVDWADKFVNSSTSVSSYKLYISTTQGGKAQSLSIMVYSCIIIKLAERLLKLVKALSTNQHLSSYIKWIYFKGTTSTQWRQVLVLQIQDLIFWAWTSEVEYDTSAMWSPTLRPVSIAQRARTGLFWTPVHPPKELSLMEQVII